MTGFLQRRISKVFIPWLFVSVIYLIYYYFMGGFKLIIGIVNQKQNGYLIIQNSWFIWVIIIFYVIFWGVFQRFSAGKAIVLVFIVTNIFAIIANALGLGVWWYYSGWAFSLGLLWKQYEEKIYYYINQNYVLNLVLAIVAFFAAYVLRMVNKLTIHSTLISILICLAASSIFVIVILIISMRLNIDNRTLRFLGSISLELYLIHELIYISLRSQWLWIKSDFVFVLLTLVFSIIVAYILHVGLRRGMKRGN